MKKHKILSLLLALVLVFSAAGTAFAASKSVPAGAFGTLTCTALENNPASDWSVSVTAAVTTPLRNGILAVGVAFDDPSNPSYRLSSPGEQSISRTVPVPVSIDSSPSFAYGYAEAYVPGGQTYTAEAILRLSR